MVTDGSLHTQSQAEEEDNKMKLKITQKKEDVLLHKERSEGRERSEWTRTVEALLKRNRQGTVVLVHCTSTCGAHCDLVA